jgi:hypothetical protein
LLSSSQPSTPNAESGDTSSKGPSVGSSRTWDGKCKVAANPFGSRHSSCFDSSKPYSGWFYHAPVQQVTFQLIFSSTSICISLGNHISPHKTLNQTPLQRTLQQAMRPQGLRSPRLLMLPRQLRKYPSPRALVEPKVPPTQQRL